MTVSTNKTYISERASKSATPSPKSDIVSMFDPETVMKVPMNSRRAASRAFVMVDHQRRVDHNTQHKICIISVVVPTSGCRVG